MENARLDWLEWRRAIREVWNPGHVLHRVEPAFTSCSVLLQLGKLRWNGQNYRCKATSIMRDKLKRETPWFVLLHLHRSYFARARKWELPWYGKLFIIPRLKLEASRISKYLLVNIPSGHGILRQTAGWRPGSDRCLRSSRISLSLAPVRSSSCSRAKSKNTWGEGQKLPHGWKAWAQILRSQEEKFYLLGWCFIKAGKPVFFPLPAPEWTGWSCTLQCRLFVCLVFQKREWHTQYDIS